MGLRLLFELALVGGMAPDVHVRDVLLASGSTTDSAVTANTFGPGIHYAPLADFKLLDSAYHVAKDLDINVKVGDIFAADRFYNDEIDMQKLADYGILGTEMESAGLYLLGAKLHFKALSVLTVSDLIFGDEKATAEERERTFNDMIKISLETAIQQ